MVELSAFGFRQAQQRIVEGRVGKQNRPVPRENKVLKGQGRNDDLFVIGVKPETFPRERRPRVSSVTTKFQTASPY